MYAQALICFFEWCCPLVSARPQLFADDAPLAPGCSRSNSRAFSVCGACPFPAFPAAPMNVVKYDCMDSVRDVPRPRDFTLQRVLHRLQAFGYMAADHHDLYWFPDGKFGRWAERRVLIDSDAAFARWAGREEAAGGLPQLWIYPRFETSGSKRSGSVGGFATVVDDPPPATASVVSSGTASCDEWCDRTGSDDWYTTSSDESSSDEQQPRLVSRRTELRGLWASVSAVRPVSAGVHDGTGSACVASGSDDHV